MKRSSMPLVCGSLDGGERLDPRSTDMTLRGLFAAAPSTAPSRGPAPARLGRDEAQARGMQRASRPRIGPSVVQVTPRRAGIGLPRQPRRWRAAEAWILLSASSIRSLDFPGAPMASCHPEAEPNEDIEWAAFDARSGARQTTCGRLIKLAMPLDSSSIGVRNTGLHLITCYVQHLEN